MIGRAKMSGARIKPNIPANANWGRIAARSPSRTAEQTIAAGNTTAGTPTAGRGLGVAMYAESDMWIPALGRACNSFAA
jgi:hypothetical protein